MFNLDEKIKRIELGDFQTPYELARQICLFLKKERIYPDVIVEPTCGIGSFLLAASETFFKETKIFGFDINNEYLKEVDSKLESDKLKKIFIYLIKIFLKLIGKIFLIVMMVLYSSLIFWDDKRPIEASILNMVNWQYDNMAI